jgi:hypothetical protein
MRVPVGTGTDSGGPAESAVPHDRALLRSIIAAVDDRRSTTPTGRPSPQKEHPVQVQHGRMRLVARVDSEQCGSFGKWRRCVVEAVTQLCASQPDVVTQAEFRELRRRPGTLALWRRQSSADAVTSPSVTSPGGDGGGGRFAGDNDGDVDVDAEQRGLMSPVSAVTPMSTTTTPDGPREGASPVGAQSDLVWVSAVVLRLLPVTATADDEVCIVVKEDALRLCELRPVARRPNPRPPSVLFRIVNIVREVTTVYGPAAPLIQVRCTAVS